MAARALFLTLTRNACKERQHRGLLLRSLSSSSTSSATTSECEAAEIVDQDYDNDDLKRRIFSLRLPKRSATNVLQRWVSEGRKITVSDLRCISKQLRKSHRYKHALEISEWMVSHDEFDLSDSDYAVRIDLMNKVFGIDSAERYFEALPSTAKTSETYTALLHSYAGSKLVDKAEKLYDRIKEANLSLSAVTYNELMTLYMSVGQLEKVSLVIDELKRQKVAPDLFTYNLWISSSAASLDIDGVRKILSEMILDPGSNESWERYVNLVNIYIASGHLTNSGSNTVVESEKGITQREWITYDFLIVLYGGLGNKDRLDQIWNSLRMTKQKMIGRNYACIISSYLMLGHLKEVRDVIEQWKQSASTDFDSSICNRLLKAFAEIGLTEKVATFQTILIEEGCELRDE